MENKYVLNLRNKNTKIENVEHKRNHKNLFK